LKIQQLVYVAVWGALLVGRGVGAQPVGPDGNLPLPPGVLEGLTRDGLELRSVKDAGAGVTGAKKIVVFVPAFGEEITIKWKTVPGSGDGWNNSPRRELVAYEIQKWFLDPDDYVVPPTLMRCIPFYVYELIGKVPRSRAGDFNCVLGVSAIWLSNVTVPDKLYDPKRFATDANYARNIADMNLLTYLIKHRDGRKGNFLTSKNDSDRRVFSIDNGVSFEAFPFNPLPWVTNWHKIRVSALRKKSIDRLRAIGRAELDQLNVIAEMKADENGILHTAPRSAHGDDSGVRVTDDTIQLGLSVKEINRLEERLASLLKKVDSGKIPTF
jgi:hypothetical protein